MKPAPENLPTLDRAHRRTVAALLAAALGASVVPARADDATRDMPSAEAQAPSDAPESSGFYLAALGTTTLAYRPYGADFDGPQRDITASLGAGWFATETLALELDVGATFIEGEYVATSLTPGLIWAFHPNVYTAARFIVPVDPELNLALYPGIGVTHAFESGIAPFFEANAISMVGRGEPDFGVTATIGMTYAL